MNNKYAQLYYELILKEEKTINDVPAPYRTEVTRLLEENGRRDLINADGSGRR